MPYRPQSFSPQPASQFRDATDAPAPPINNKAAQAAKTTAFAWQKKQEGSPTFTELVAQGAEGISRWMGQFGTTYSGQQFFRDPEPQPFNSEPTGKTAAKSNNNADL